MSTRGLRGWGIDGKGRVVGFEGHAVGGREEGEVGGCGRGGLFVGLVGDGGFGREFVVVEDLLGEAGSGLAEGGDELSVGDGLGSEGGGNGDVSEGRAVVGGDVGGGEAGELFALRVGAAAEEVTGPGTKSGFEREGEGERIEEADVLDLESGDGEAAEKGAGFTHREVEGSEEIHEDRFGIERGERPELDHHLFGFLVER